MSITWTEDQKKAIEARRGTLLLSAAAGSGKTAVLVQRVIERLTDKVSPTPPERLLVVTFTKAAASEMKQKIISKIGSLSAKNPKDYQLLRLGMQMQNANIGTMDSFCIRLIRENFSTLGISPDFRTCEGGELSLMRSDAMEQTIDYLHSNKTEELEPLFEMFFKGGSDALLATSIEKLYDSSCSYPFPDLWLDEVENMYTDPKDFKNNIWADTIFKNVKNILEYCDDLNNEAINMISAGRLTEPNLYEALYINFNIIKDHIDRCRAHILNKEWDELIEYAEGMTFYNMRKGKKSPLKDELAKKHNTVRDILQKNIVSSLTATKADHKEDMDFLKPIVKGLIYAVRLFAKNFREIKKEANVLDFSDSLHYALNLLYDQDDDGIRLSPFAKDLSAQFDEVLIDEYQDTNKAQDMLFRAISKDESNMFMVGDIKQSIYSFRLANPEIFIGQSEKLPFYEDENYPAKINLSQNFRSKKSILDAINFIFFQIMSRDAGSINYDENQMLYCGRGEDEKENDDTSPDTEIHFVELLEEKENASDDDDTTKEAKYLARLIKKMVADKTLIEVDGEKRPVDYGDFCILLRSAKNNLPIYSDTLQKYNIPVQGENSRAFFESREVLFFLSLLKVIDNPINDIDLVSVMLSPLYGFKEDDLAQMRAKDRRGSIYDLLIAEKQAGNKKVRAFLEDLQEYRSLSVSGSIAGFVRKLISKTKYKAILSAMQDEDERKNNLSLFIEYAENYDSWGSVGLSGFMRYINRLKENERESKNYATKSASLSQGHTNRVKIMTIHNSKGLEFPVVILAKAMKNFNLQDTFESLLVHPKLGLGLKIQKAEEFKKYETIPYMAIRNQMTIDAIAEEMRVFYVALTRAEEKLIVLAGSKNIRGALNNTYSSMAYNDKRLSPQFVLNQKQYGAWLLATALRHPRAGEILRKELDIDLLPDNFLINDAPKLKLVLSSIDDIEEEGLEICDGEGLVDLAKPDEEKDEEINKLIKTLNDRMAYSYPYKELSHISSKYAASDLSATAYNADFVYFKKPKFLQEGQISGADIGTANHKFLQYCDFLNASKNLDFELDRLRLAKKLTDEDIKLINKDRLDAFFKSPIFGRILKADKLYREKRFSITLPAGQIDKDLPENLAGESVFIQGVIDLVFIENNKCVILDYKTDNIKEEDDFIKRYAPQLNAYKEAATRVFGLEVKETIIYSLSLNKPIFL